MENSDEILQKISKLIQINSQEGPAEEGAPFGKGPAEALKLFLSFAQDMGFETRNLEGYAGEVIFGEGEEFAILAHVDVVPAGNGWTHPPFGGEIDYAAKKIWGRGAIDDKGPAVITLYALKALKDEGFKPRRKIKFIIGCNEESGWGCIDYYKSHAHMPEEGISPDADFPVIYAEKGILHLLLTFKAAGDYTSLRGGGAANMVCDLCTAEAPLNPQKLAKSGLEYAQNTVLSRGVTAHGSTPEKGVNAIPPMLEYLGLEREVLTPLNAVTDRLLKFCDQTGRLTISPNVIKGGKGEIYITCDIRYPATYKESEVLSEFERAGIPYKVLHAQAPLYNDQNSFLITTLCSVYNQITGKSARPVAIGGGTYARALKYGAGFGPEEEGDESVMHKPDEYITFQKVESCFKIYKEAIKRLTK